MDSTTINQQLAHLQAYIDATRLLTQWLSASNPNERQSLADQMNAIVLNNNLDISSLTPN